MAEPARGEGAIRRHFENQAKACDQLGSPFTAKVCRALGAGLRRGAAIGDRVLDWPSDPAADLVALRLCGGLHALVLSGANPDVAGVYPPNEADDAALAQAVMAAVTGNETFLLPFLDSPPQTNEIGRSAVLMPGLLAVARETGLPLALHEIGSSAGLNLLFDRFHYRYGEAEWGEPASPVRLAPEVRGSPPPLAGRLELASRQGCDIAPIDVTDPGQRLRLKAYIWADQTERLHRLDAALRLAQEHPVRLERADAADFLQRRLETRTEGSAFVLMHSSTWQYLPAETQARIAKLLEEAGREATRRSPLAWLSKEPLSLKDPHDTLNLTVWPGGETRRLARCDYHGRWVEWLG